MVRMVPTARKIRTEPKPKPVKWLRNDIMASLLESSSPADCFIKESPRNMIAKPITKPPMFFFFVSFDEVRMKPRAIRGTEKMAMSTENPRAVIHAVRVVPMLAPIITPMAFARESSPAFTKLTTIMVVAEEDCTRAVIAVPVRTLLNAFEVIDARKDRSRSPATF